MQTIGRNQYDKEENGLGELMLFQELFERYFRSLVTYAYRYVNDWNVSEDIVQDVFMALWVNRNEIDCEDPVKPDR